MRYDGIVARQQELSAEPFLPGQKSIIEKLARAMHSRNPHIPLDDLLQEARLAALGARAAYDPQRGDIEHLTARAVRNRLLRYVEREGAAVGAWQSLDAHDSWEKLFFDRRHRPDDLKELERMQLRGQLITEIYRRLPRGPALTLILRCGLDTDPPVCLSLRTISWYLDASLPQTEKWYREAKRVLRQSPDLAHIWRQLCLS